MLVYLILLFGNSGDVISVGVGERFGKVGDVVEEDIIGVL